MLLENEMVIDLTARKRYGKIEGLFMGEVVEAGSLLIINRCLYKATRLYKGPEYVQALVKFVRSITTHDEIMEMEKRIF